MKPRTAWAAVGGLGLVGIGLLAALSLDLPDLPAGPARVLLLPFPTAGSTAQYAGPDTVTLEVHGLRHSVDARGTIRGLHVVAFESGAGPRLVFVDPSTRAVDHVVIPCGRQTAGRCDPLSHVDWQSAGLPGLLGATPFHGIPLEDGSRWRSAAVCRPCGEPLDLRVEAPAHGSDWRALIHAPIDPPGGWLVAIGEIGLRPGVPFPTRLRVDAGEYTLVSWTRGGGEPWFADTAGPTATPTTPLHTAGLPAEGVPPAGYVSFAAAQAAAGVPRGLPGEVRSWTYQFKPDSSALSVGGVDAEVDHRYVVTYSANGRLIEDTYTGTDVPTGSTRWQRTTRDAGSAGAEADCERRSVPIWDMVRTTIDAGLIAAPATWTYAVPPACTPAELYVAADPRSAVPASVTFEAPTGSLRQGLLAAAAAEGRG